MVDEKVIMSRVFNPREPGLFRKPSKSEPAEFTVAKCSNGDCPLLARGECIAARVFECFCPYVSWSVERGPTGRSGKYYGWIQERQKLNPGVPQCLRAPPEKLAFIGEYVYLPYAHMDMCRDVPFLSHSQVFMSGKPFIPKSAWTIKTVAALLDFRPQALMGGEITSYQKEKVPLFVDHIREMDADMWQQLIAARPQYDIAPNYVGRTALLKTLAHPISIPAKDSRYPVTWEWDGEKARTTSRHAYSDTWGGLKSGEVEIAFTPDDKTAIEVRSNDWVTPETVFVD